MSETLVDELLVHWESLCREGQMVSAEELCEELGHDSPQLVEELDRRIREVVTVGRLMTVPANDATLQMDGTTEVASEPLRSPTEDEVIFSVGQYDYFKFLAKGGVGEVYTAGDKDFGRDVALKFIQRDQEEHPESKGQFLVEGEITARLEHPGIVPVYGFGYTSDGRPFHVMRLIRGLTLGDRISSYHREASALDASQRRVRFRELMTRFISVCNTIAYAHNRGILHRDIKPDNVMLGQYGETLVVDWGLAQPIERSDAARSSGETTLKPGSGRSEEELCFAQGVVGTPCYMSPEQAEGKHDLTPATDIYSLGALLYRIITGETAIQGTHIGDILEKAKEGDFPPPRAVNSNVSRPLQAICLKAMSQRPGDRYETALLLAEDVERWLADEKVSVYNETLPRRVARWARRHRTSALAIVSGLFLLVLIAGVVSLVLARSYRSERKSHEEAVQQTERMKILAEREAEALEATLRTTAYALAQNVSNNLEHQLSVLERLARDDELVRLVKQWNQAEQSENTQLKEDAARQLGIWLNEEFDSELPSQVVSSKDNDESENQYGNWFVNDLVGTQIARASTNKDPVTGQKTVGKNYSWRSYFNGSVKDSSDIRDRIEKKVREIEQSGGSQRDVADAIRVLADSPLREGPHLGAVYVADKFNVMKIPISTPIRDPENGNVIGVLGMATDIGHFPQLQDVDVFLVDLRDDYLNGRARGLILQHPQLKDFYSRQDSEASNFKFARFQDQRVLDVIGGKDLSVVRGELNTGLISKIQNPLTGERHRFAAFCPVQPSERWRQRGTLSDDPCWSVLVLRKELTRQVE